MCLLSEKQRSKDSNFIIRFVNERCLLQVFIPFAGGCHYENKANDVISIGGVVCQQVYIV